MAIVEQTDIHQLLRSSRTIAVLGASDRTTRPAYYVPAYLSRSGYQVLPVNPQHAGETLWERLVVSTLGELDVPVDIVDVFRRAEHIPAHLDDILAMSPLPRAVWFQLGIRNDDAARRLEQAGIAVIQDRCILIEHRSLV